MALSPLAIAFLYVGFTVISGLLIGAAELALDDLENGR